jgi:hypothetical protein
LQNPKMSREKRIELRNSKGHEMTFKRYHRYSGMCNSILFVREFSLTPLDLIAPRNEGITNAYSEHQSGENFIRQTSLHKRNLA